MAKKNREYSHGPKVQPLVGKTQNQKDYIRSILGNDITFCTGPAGSGKSFVAAGIAAEMLSKGVCDKIVVTRPLICTGKDIGSLPGELEEKIHPYMMPMHENMSYFFGPQQLRILLEKKIIRFEPLELMRGMTYHNSIMILDEAQNCTIDQIKMFVTRMGENSKSLINGDLKQTDLHKNSGLNECINRVLYYEVEGIGVSKLELADIQRNDIIGRFLIAMEDDHE